MWFHQGFATEIKFIIYVTSSHINDQQFLIVYPFLQENSTYIYKSCNEFKLLKITRYWNPFL
jgi:hypothetical protein